MALSEQLVLETRQAFRELDALQGRLDNLSDIRLDITADTSGLNADLERSRSLVEDTASSFGEVNQQVTLTTDEYKRAVRAIDEGADAARAVAIATGDVADEAISAESALRRVAETMGISEDEARDLARSVGESSREAANLDADLRQVARSMGLSEDEARQFAAEVGRAADDTRVLGTESRGVEQVWVRIGARLAGLAAAAFGARAIFGAGFERFTTIEDSTRALTVQLQSAEAAADALAATLDVVRGTPFNLDQFAAATSQLIAFGVEADRIPGILTAIGEAAATRGARAPEFVERLVTLFGQITTAGRISGEEIRRFSEAGVNALAILANSFGVTTEEIRSMVSAGLVPAEEAIEALTRGIVEGTEGAAGATVALGGTMEGLRETLSGARGGLEAAVARFGANLVDAASPAILAWLQAATTGFDELGEAIVGAADDAEDARNSFIDFVADLPRGFGAVTDTVTGLGSAFVSLVDSAAAIGRADPAAAVDEFENALRRLDDTTANIAIRVIEQDIIDFLRAGGSELDAFANAIDRLQDKDVLSEATIARFAQLTAVDDTELRAVLGTFVELGDEAGFTSDELRVLLDVLGRVLGIQRGGGLDFDRGAVGAARRESAALALALESEAFALRVVSEAADEADLSLFDFLQTTGDLAPEVQAAVDSLDDGALAAIAFNDAAAGLAEAIQVDFGDVVSEFDLLISKTNEAGEKVPTTVAEIIADLQEQADRLARLETATAILTALGLDDLAANLLASGAVEAAEEFVNDLESAFEAEQLLDVGGVIPTDLADQLNEALRQGDITPGLLDLVSNFSSQQVQEAVRNAALASGGLFGPELTTVLESLSFEGTTIDLSDVDLTPPSQGAEDAGDEIGDTVTAATVEAIAANQQDYSSALQNALLQAAIEGDSPAVLAELAAMAEALTVTIPIEFGPIPDLTVPSVTAPAGATTTGGTVNNVTVTNEFNTTPQPTTDTQRITNSTESAIKNLGPN